MRKLGVLLACTALLISLSACGSKNEKPAAAPAASTAVSSAADGSGQQLNITASNWKFDQAEYKVKKGQPVTVTLKNAEGVHGLEIEKVGVKLDNKKTTATFTPDKAGKYTITCTIPCGTDHMKMRSVLVVEE